MLTAKRRCIPIWFCGLLSCCGVIAPWTHPAWAQKRPRRNATTVQLPTFGVLIDAAGEMKLQAFPDPAGRLREARRQAARRDLPVDLQRQSPLRKISLSRLDQVVAARLANGRPPTPIQQHLAGLQRIQYVFLYPDEHDILLAGPAEGFAPDASDRMVGLEPGLPPLRLDDLAVALRTYATDAQAPAFVGCTISPTRDGLERLVAFQRTIPRVIHQSQRPSATLAMLQGSRNALGIARINVFGISDRTHMGRTMLEADYRMKLIGIGLEPKPIAMTTFLDALQGAAHQTLQQWWFMPDPAWLRVSPDRQALEMLGQGVALHSEEHQITAAGRLQPTGRPAGAASQRYAHSFTEHYDDIADRVPVFAELRNVVDVLMAAAFLGQQDGLARCDCPLACLTDAERLDVEDGEAPRQTACVVNAVWKRNRLLAPAGGVTINPRVALLGEHLTVDQDGELSRLADQSRPQHPPDDAAWWWD